MTGGPDDRDSRGPSPAPSVNASHGGVGAGRDVVNPTVYNVHIDKQVLPTPERPRCPHNLPELPDHFVGREAELAELHEMLTSEGAAAIAGVVAWGDGGVGKSLLALAYAYRHLEDYPGGVVYLRGDTATLASDLAKVARSWGFDVPDGEPPRDTALRMRQFLQDPRRPTLLLLDNLDDPRWLTPANRELLPKHPCRRLVTTRQSHLSGMRPLPLDNLQHEDAVELLAHFRPDARDHADPVSRIARGLERWALGLTLVGVYMQCRPGVRWEGYATDLEARGLLSLQDVDQTVALDGEEASRAHPVRPDRYHHRVTALLDDVLKTLSDPEVRLLEYAALLPRDLVPISWLIALLEADELTLRPAGPGEDSVATSHVEDLLVRRLLRETERPDSSLRTVAVHRLVSSELVTRLHKQGTHDTRMRSVLSHAQSRAVHLFDNAVHDHAGRAELPVLQALLELEGLADEGPFALETAELANATHGGLRALGDLPSARHCLERALRLCEAHLPPNDPKLAISYSNLALVQKAEGDLRGARQSLERALTIDQAHYPSDHPTLAIRYSNLSQVQQAEGDLSGARQNLERALTIEEAHFPDGHPNLAIRYHNLASVEQASGNPTAARAHWLHAKSIADAKVPPKHGLHALIAAGLRKTSTQED